MIYKRLLESTLTHALSYIESLDKIPVTANAGLKDLRQSIGHPLTE